MSIAIKKVRGYEFDSSVDAYAAFSNGSQFKIDRESRVVSRSGEVVGHLKAGRVLVLENNPRLREEVGELTRYLDSLAGTL